MATKEPVPIPFQLAKTSWIAPFIVFGVNVVLRTVAGPPGEASRAVIYSILGVSFYFIGLICGLAALFGVPKYGKKGILIPSLVGVLLNSTLLVFVTVVFVNAIIKQ